MIHQLSSDCRPPRAVLSRAGKAVLIGLIAVLGAAVAAGVWLTADWYVAYPPEAEAAYVGTHRCAACHETEHHAWSGSHHDRAMELATPDSVLGDFNDANFERLGVVSNFFTKDGRYYVNTEGPDGEYDDFEIKYTFGVDPLQQYMVEFPDGRVQVLRVSWDVHEKRWFFVPPPDARDERLLPGDPMHWTGTSQNWNHMCAECHSTNLQKNYDLQSNTYRTTFSEIDVGCEACHGPGSIHVELAEAYSPFWDRNHGYGLARLKGLDPANQLQTCASCHSRRSGVHPDFRPGHRYLDHYDLAMLLPDLYHPNGQILDEVYVYGSFLQSKMHAEGVRCTDCHNPHSAGLKFEGNRLCGQCHQPGKYDTPSHHHHAADSAGAQCVSCHMPARTYMEIDSRRDHQFGVPRPDLTVELDTPNACNDCHTGPEETPAWAAEQIERWRPSQQSPADQPRHFAHAFAAVAARQPEAEGLLVDVVERRDLPAIVRATAVSLLSGYDGSTSRYRRSKAVEDADPLVRLAAVQSYPGGDAAVTWDRLSPLLKDPIRAIRVAAAWRLADFAQTDLSADHERALTRGLDEYRQAQGLALDRAAAHLNLGDLAERLRDPNTAAEHYRHAVRIEPYLAGARSQLARLLDGEVERLAQEGAQARRLLEIRDEARKLREEEVELFARDAELLEDSPLAWYRYGLMLYLVERTDEAAEALERACELDPASYEFRLALTLLYEKQQAWTEAVRSAETLVRLRPGDEQALAVLQQMRGAADASARGN